MSIVNISDLPKDIITKIPLSLRVNQTTLNTDQLPFEIKYIVERYLESIPKEISYDNKKIYDLLPELSVYNDLVPVERRKDLILEYFKNYLVVGIGSYPFDVNMGCRLKQQLQTKDTMLRNTLIGNEVRNIAGTLGADYDINIVIKKISITPVSEYSKEYYTHVAYYLTIILQIEKEEITLAFPNV